MLQAAWRWLANADRQRTLAFIGSAVAALLVGGWQLYLHLKPDAEKEPAGQTVTIGINIGPGATVGTIHQGETEAVRRKKLEDAKRLLGAEISVNLVALDRRLALIDGVVQPVAFEARLDAVRRQVAPAAESPFSEGYRQLSAGARAASLRHALNGEPLRSDVPLPLLQVLLDAGASGEPVQVFYSALVEVGRVTDSLVEAIENGGRAGAAGSAERRHADETIALAAALVRNRSRIAYLHGARLLDSLGDPARSADLSGIRLLEPRRPLAAAEYQQRLAPLVDEAGRLLAERQALVGRAVDLVDAKLIEYERANERLRILPSDTSSEVIGKARALRELGRTGDSVAAFARYAELFAAEDDQAAAYARIAQTLTLQLPSLRLTGGVYLYEVKKRGRAERAGLRRGDIIIGCAGTATPGPSELADVLSKVPEGEPLRIDYLRLRPTGEFTRGTVSVTAKPLGVGMMPI